MSSLGSLAALSCAVLVSTAAAAAPSSPKRSEIQQQIRFGNEMALRGSWHEAAFRYRKAIEGDPENAFVQSNLGVALESIGAFDEALAAYKRAAELSPKNEKIRENLDRLTAYLASRNTPTVPPPAAGPREGEPSGGDEKPEDEAGEAAPGGGEPGPDRGSGARTAPRALTAPGRGR